MYSCSYDAPRTLREVYGIFATLLLEQIHEDKQVDVPTWQGQDVRDSAWGRTYEIQNAIFHTHIPGSVRETQIVTDCNMPWAEEHFLERVSGIPYNPPPSAANWPFTQKGHEVHTVSKKFSHTYPERFWPKRVGERHEIDDRDPSPNRGIRFDYGDLSDVVNLLRKEPQTRQAYLPVWFPEDTGVVHRERVPCTLGYHFMIRNNQLSITYFIRSVDFLRHFPDDVYLAMRLAQWVRDQLKGNQGIACGMPEHGELPKPKPRLGLGTLTMHMCSLHVFEGDIPIMEHRYGA